ncbi:MAG: ADP-ribosyl-[dinitrogen reductase] hydrolase [gamma proteobacterium symbiont of Ctena orbiculata]|nr:MAG: ADP-ribosyl-[dinitrogen reductase] hydrolase [gamma proteobacterium symbiont of Ctena orbiculata]PVV15019.1 MAG: ADP-ribosyl-[dinitrogen reductase] hydrolase [gamma proteobacterium symbiont of Ctena orbiculata]PVV24363.1 MAG: ADP-ribosyl-[dinitrogen reductase] hydrolase [gamma proteobacterium symbiont of Ctena orbiculata]
MVTHDHSGEPALSPSLEQRAVGAYVGLAVGDALGATTEFLTPREIREKHGIHDRILGGGWLRLKAGQVTDDTEMSLALGESILAHGGVEDAAVAEAFSQWMRTKPIDIGNTVRRGIVHYRSTGETAVAMNEFDAGNGACMRSLPIALFYCDALHEERVQASRAQSHITHNNPLADAGTETLVEMVVSALKGLEKSLLETMALSLVSRFPLYRFDKRRMENPSGYIVETLRAVFQAFFSNDSYQDILIDLVNRGGDADTTGAIAGMLAGAYYGEERIPHHWRKSLDIKTMLACRDQALGLLAQGRQIDSTQY